MARRRAMVVTLLLALLICVAIVLTSGIGHVELEPGRLLAGSEDGGPRSSGGWSLGPSRTIVLPGFDFLRILFPISFVLVVVSTAFSIRDRQIRPDLLLALFVTGALLLAIIFATGPGADKVEEEAVLAEEETASDPIPPPGTRDEPLRVDAGPQQGASRWPLFVTAALAAMLVALTAVPLVLFFLRWMRRRHVVGPTPDEILEIAADAARQIRAGAGPVGVVQQCYARMLRALSDRSGVNPRFRTPREFASAMREVGLHSKSVDALTEMFELVRYGGRSDEALAARAYGCLAALRLSHEAT
jgi:hypothetical protein